jgi:hypothetical protein
VNELKAAAYWVGGKVMDGLKWVWGKVQKAWEEFRIGDGHASAWFRQGFKELGRYLYAFPDHQAPVEEYGLFGTATPQQAAEQMKAPNLYDTRKPPAKDQTAGVVQEAAVQDAAATSPPTATKDAVGTQDATPVQAPSAVREDEHTLTP